MDNIIWSMQYTIYSLMKKHEHFMLKKNVLALWIFQKNTENDFWIWFKSFCIWFYMIEYDVYHRKMMFKVICMQSKPGKHAKYNEMWRNTSKKNWKCQKKTYRFRFLPYEMMRSKAQHLHFWCPGLEFELKTPR